MRGISHDLAERIVDAHVDRYPDATAANTAASKAMWAMWAAKDDLAQAALDEAAT